MDKHLLSGVATLGGSADSGDDFSEPPQDSGDEEDIQPEVGSLPPVHVTTPAQFCIFHIYTSLFPKRNGWAVEETNKKARCN